MAANRPILLAEDNQFDMELTLEALQEHGLTNEIVVVRDGVEALDYLYRRGQYADRPPTQLLLILLDLKMPRIDGLEVLSQVKQDPLLRVIPVVMLTSSREERDIVASYNLGANAYVVKPVAFESFAEVAKQIGLFWLFINEPPIERRLSD